MKPWFVLFAAFAVGCSGPDRWTEVDEEISVFEPGSYTGSASIDVRARFGSVQLGRESCDVDIDMFLTAAGAVSGSVGCDLGDRVGFQTVDIEGVVEQAPWVFGEVEVEDRVLDWEGGFTADHAFFGEIAGREDVEGITVVFEGWFEVEHIAVDDTRPPGNSYGGY